MDKICRYCETPINEYEQGFYCCDGQMIIELEKTLEEIIPMCGNPNAVDACRLIVDKCQGVLK